MPENRPLIRILEAAPTPKKRAPAGEVLVIPDMVHDRYASFQLIPWWDQDRLKKSTVLVAGAGALGNEVLKNLALIGVGRILIVDFDHVELGNLGRSVLFRSTDEGRPKAEAAADAVRQINPDVTVLPLTADVTLDVGLGVFRRVDVVIGCLDNREARLFLNRGMYHLNRPWVDGAIQELMGVARVFWPGRGACYECTMTTGDWRAIDRRYSCSLVQRERLKEGKVPTTPTIASIVAAMETQEALKILHGIPVQAGMGFFYNGINNHAHTVVYPVRDNCQGHSFPYEEIMTLPEATTAKTTLRELLALAQQKLGSGAQIELDFDLVTEVFCQFCDQSGLVLRPRRRMKETFLICPTCGRPRSIEMIHTIKGQEAFLDETLASIGIPPLHIIAARNGPDFMFLELTGDESMALTR
jgi:molybdopterin/thiamine biosynthesis adenylyltransferase